MHLALSCVPPCLAHSIGHPDLCISRSRTWNISSQNFALIVLLVPCFPL